jgi:uncharacterized membrane protein YdbT with pleckstrin-like domain
VQEVTIRPTSKFIKAGTLALLAMAVGALVAYFGWMRDSNDLGLFPLLLLAILIWPAVRWIRLRYTKAVLSGDRLRYETGIATKSSRIIQLSKIQDVRVEQSVVQRMFSIGNISIETAGEASRLTLVNVDDPHKVADEIMTASQRGSITA